MKNILKQYKDYIKKNNNIYVPVNCKNTHKYISLDNKLDILFIEDTISVNSCAVVYVECGSNNDPEDVEGLAHFLEHLLFMGSTKYSDVDAYFKQINMNGGSSNASTARDYTTYFFEISNNVFLNTLDIFSRFFIDPLFNVKYVEKEVNAVNSEHNKNIGTDMWRLRNVSIKLMTDGINSSFGTGTTNTLLGNRTPEELREKVINFFEKYYSSHKMKLFISHNNIDETFCNKVSNMFKDIILRKDTNFTNIPTVNIYEDKYELLKIKTIGDVKNLSLQWLTDGMYRCDENIVKTSYSILGHILGNENKGSICNYLINKKLIRSLSYYIELYDEKTKITIAMSLTDRGFKKWKYIVYSINNYIKNIYDLDCYDKYYKEYQKFILYSLQTYENMSGSALCFNYFDIYKNIRIDFKYLPIHKILYSYSKEHYNETLLKMNMKNVKVILTSNIFKKLSLIDDFYGTEYEIKTKKIKNKKNKISSSPELNKYISTDLKMFEPIDKTDKYTQIDTSKNRYYIKNNNSYETYLMYGKICIDIKHDNKDLLYFEILMSLYISYIEKINNAQIYMMNDAGIYISIDISMEKMYIKILGCQNNIDKHFQEVMGWYFDKSKFKLKQDIFDDVYKSHEKSYKNWELQEPYSIINHYLRNHVNKNKNFLQKEYLDVLKKIKNFDGITEQFNKGTIIGVFGGSVKLKTIHSIIETLDTYVKYTDKKITIDKIDLTKQNITIKNLNPISKDNAIAYGIYAGHFEETYDSNNNEWFKMYPILSMMTSILHDRFFNIIRTEKQLGYIAKCLVIDVSSVIMIKDIFVLFIIQSSYTNLQEHIEDFLNNNDISNFLTDEEFDILKSTMIENFLEKYTEMSDDISNKFSHMLITDNLEADRYQLYVKYLKKLDKKKFIDFVENILSKGKRIIVNINTNL